MVNVILVATRITVSEGDFCTVEVEDRGNPGWCGRRWQSSV